MRFLKFSVLAVGIMLLRTQTQAQQDLSTMSIQIYEHNENINTNYTDYYSYQQTCQNDQGSFPESESKTFTKSFPLNHTEGVNLESMFGNINIITWNKNEVKIDADVKAYANSKAKAQKLLDQTNVTASKNDGTVNVITRIDSKNEKNKIGVNSWNWESYLGEINMLGEIIVYLTVYMPAGNELKVSQKFGNIVLPDFLGPTSSTVQFGNLKTGDLKNAKNTISIRYGNADLQNVNEASISQQFGNGIIVSINNLQLNSQYSNVRIGQLKGTGNITQQYGDGISIASANTIDAEIQFSMLKVDKLTGDLRTTTKYGKIIVNEIMPTCKTINANIRYTPISLTFSSAYGGTFKVNTNYGSFEYADNIKAKKVCEDEDNPKDNTYEGAIKQGGTNIIYIDSRYGSVSFK